eukprot:TRINITY_DN370_c0_g1_i1.p1 TRINITY_DN370_c0_g1~~TRINITY_DN370_c0_g1_i1.p1  ORF type:complete len:689 (+),score=261.08 TRINITY_DN370_c0_g1_i1:89-2155(+)
MQCFAATALLLIASLGLVAGDAINPIQKVLSMIAELKEKVVADGAAEEKAYDEYAKFCVVTKRDTSYEIQTGEKDVEELQATIAKASSDVESSGNRAAELQDAISKTEGKLAAVTDVSKTEQADFKASIEELKSSIDMLGRATKTLKDKLKGSALLQQPVQGKEGNFLKALHSVMDAAALPHGDKASLVALVQGPAYEAKSGGIIQVLEEMKEKARSDMDDIGQQASKALHSFKMEEQALKSQISADKQEQKDVNSLKAEASEEKATAESSLQVAAKGLADDKATLAEYEASCQQADEGFAASKKSRAEEVEALTKATDVIKEKTGAAESGTYKAGAFVQISARRSGARAPSSGEFDIADRVRRLAQKHPSADLNKLASNIESLMQTGEPEKDVFADIKELIAKMISDKKAQAQKDATKKAYCETEKAKTKDKLDELQTSNDKLGAKLDKKESEAATLKSEADTLASELTALVQQQQEMDATRKEEKEVYTKTHKDLSDGLDGVRMALKVLRDYYQGTSQAGGESLVQVDPPSFGHSAQEGSSTGIIGMLEVVESDFSRDLVAAETQEESAAEEYVKLTDQNKVTKIEKENEQKFKAETSASITQAIQEKITDKEALAEELAAVQKYSKSLEEQCLEGGLTYEERVAAREAEIAGLKDALKAIGGTDLTLLQVQSSSLRGVVAKKHQQ